MNMGFLFALKKFHPNIVIAPLKMNTIWRVSARECYN